MARAQAIAAGRPRPAGGFELYAWLFMRLSGLALIFLALGHLVIMHLINSIDNIDFQFVAQRYAKPFWRWYDWLMLTLALLHGCNGLRTVLEDYCHRPLLRALSLWALTIACGVFFVIGSLVIILFQPPGFVK